MMNTVFLDRDTFNQDIDFTAIEQQTCSLRWYPMTQQEQVIECCRDAHCIISNIVQLSAASLKLLPKSKLVCIAATGINNIDLAAAKAMGIAVVNVAGYTKHTVPQYVFAQILAYYSKTEQHNRNTQQGLWPQREIFCVLGEPMYQLANKTLGLIGYGALAQAVEKIALAFDMHVLIVEHQGATTIRPGRVSFEQLLNDLNIISLHCPQTPETTGLIN